MANYRAIATGNWSNPATWGGGAVPPNGEAHNIYSNNFTVTIDQDVNVNLITNAAVTATFVGGGTSTTHGGGFFVSVSGYTIVANTIRKGSSSVAFTTSGSASLNIIGNIIGAASGGNFVSGPTMIHGSTGNLNVTGNITGGSEVGLGSNAVNNTSTGTITVVGNVTGGTGGNSANSFSYGIQNLSTGIVNVTGSVRGGSTTTGQIGIQGSGQINIVGAVNSGSTSASLGISTNGSLLTIIGDITAANGIVAVSSSATTNRFSGSFLFSADGTNPITCSKYTVSPTPLNALTRYAANGSGTFVNMYTADNALGQANPTDVRSGVSYASGNLTGRLTVPARGSVALSVNYGPSMPFTATRSGTTATATLAYSYPLVVGDQMTVTGASNAEWNSTYTIASVVSGTSVTFTVPDTHSATAGTGALMQTTGTAVLDPAAVASAVWGAATSSLTSAGSIGERLKNSATVATTGEQLATALTAP